jgi:putative hemolysin
MMVPLLLLAFLLLLACSAFFSSAETVYFSIDPIQLRRIGEKHAATGERLRALLAAPTRLLSTILIGNTLVNIALSNVGYVLARLWVPAYSELVAIPAVTLLLIFFGEIGPKNIGLLYTGTLARLYAPVLRTAEILLYPLRFGLDRASRRLAHLFRPAGKTLSEEEFETVLDISREEGILNADELAMIKAIVDLEDLHASDVMTPRVDFIGIDLDDPEEQPRRDRPQGPAQFPDPLPRAVRRHRRLSRCPQVPARSRPFGRGRDPAAGLRARERRAQPPAQPVPEKQDPHRHRGG